MKTKTSYITLTALFAALIFISITILHIPIGVNGGYIHIGDALIFLVASILPRSYAICAAVFGSTLADLTTAPIWAPATFVIKILVAVSFSNKNTKILHMRNIIGMILAFPITIFGYFLAEYLLFGNIAVALPSMIGNLIQCIASCIIYVFLALSFDRMHFKNKF